MSLVWRRAHVTRRHGVFVALAIVTDDIHSHFIIIVVEIVRLTVSNSDHRVLHVAQFVTLRQLRHAELSVLV